jgi:hypothetical protein
LPRNGRKNRIRHAATGKGEDLLMPGMNLENLISQRRRREDPLMENFIALAMIVVIFVLMVVF